MKLDTCQIEHKMKLIAHSPHKKIMKLEIISKYPVGSTCATPLLFVHGACHAAWCWDVHFLDYFAQHGFTVHAVSLREHGNSEGLGKLRWTRIADYVDDVANTVRQLPNPPVLIGHSMGGFVIQKYLEDHPAPAGVLLASAPPAGILPSTLRIARRHPMATAKANLTCSWLPLMHTSRFVRENLFSEDMADEEVLSYSKQFKDESFLAYLDMLALDLPKPEKVKTPLLVLGGAQDNFIRPSEIIATAQAYDAPYEIVPNTAHEMMLDTRWRTVAERILHWLKERKLMQQLLSAGFSSELD
jgi:pimeloyl-ACP methyl ester carboxylesterase